MRKYAQEHKNDKDGKVHVMGWPVSGHGESKAPMKPLNVHVTATKKTMRRRRLAGPNVKVYSNASVGLDLAAPVKSLNSNLNEDRQELSHQVQNIQKAHDDAEANNKQAGTLLAEEKSSMEKAIAAKQVLEGEMYTTGHLRKVEQENFPPLPKEVNDIRRKL